MSLRTQAWLCFAAAGLALIGLPDSASDKYVVAAVAALIGVSLWLRDGRRREARAARLAELAERDDEDGEGGEGAA